MADELQNMGMIKPREKIIQLKWGCNMGQSKEIIKEEKRKEMFMEPK